MNNDFLSKILENIHDGVGLNDVKMHLRIGIAMADLINNLAHLSLDGLSSVEENITTRRAEALQRSLADVSLRGQVGELTKDAMMVEVYDIILEHIVPTINQRRTWEEIERYMLNSLYPVKHIEVQQHLMFVEVKLDYQRAYIDRKDLPFPPEDTATKLFELQMRRQNT